MVRNEAANGVGKPSPLGIVPSFDPIKYAEDGETVSLRGCLSNGFVSEKTNIRVETTIKGVYFSLNQSAGV